MHAKLSKNAEKGTRISTLIQAYDSVYSRTIFHKFIRPLMHTDREVVRSAKRAGRLNYISTCIHVFTIQSDPFPYVPLLDLMFFLFLFKL